MNKLKNHAGGANTRECELSRRSQLTNISGNYCHEGHFMITVKDNDNSSLLSDPLNREKLLMIADKISEYCEADIIDHNFELGDQKRPHIHAICKLADGDVLPKIESVSKKLKTYPPKHYKIVIDDTGKEILLKSVINLNSITYRITRIESEEHLKNSLLYIYKESNDFNRLATPSPDFIDD